MNTETLERLVRVLESTSLVEIQYSSNGESFRLVKSAGSSHAATPAFMPQPAQAVGALPAAANSPRAGNALATIVSGMAGIFHVAPAPGAPPFVNVGDVIEEGQQVGIIEAMKTLNAVEADRAGRVVAIRAENGQAVDSGTVLLEIETIGASDV
ncbi:acetyl-CoA carboxylase biotin carboxyl carrier protein [Achromobacter aloeverae]